MRIHRLTGDRVTDSAGIGPVDVALDALGATPTADATMAAYDSLRGHGTLVLIGGVRQDLTIPYGDLMHRRLTLDQAGNPPGRAASCGRPAFPR